VKTRTRRGVAALSTAAAVAAAAMATAPASVAATGGWTATDGKIVTSDGASLWATPASGGTSTRLIEPGGAVEDPAWSPDGSRLAYSDGSYLHTVSSAGTYALKLPGLSGGSPHATHPTFVNNGADIVFQDSATKRLYWEYADGSGYAQPLLPTTETQCDAQPGGALDGSVVFVRGGSGCSGTTPHLVLLSGTTGKETTLVQAAAQPAVSPDGTRVAFVKADADGYQQVWTIGTDGSGLRQLTTGALSYATPSWSGTGGRIVAEDATGHQHVLTVGADSVSDATLDAPGTSPAWQPDRKNSTARVWGADSAHTTIAASRWTWNTVGKSAAGLLDAKAAVLIDQDSPSYALTAAALAGRKQGPVLPTAKSSLSSAASAELKRTLKKGATVYLVGGTDFLSSKVSSQVTALGFTPKRLAGTSRYSTSVAVAKSITSSPQYVFLATGTDYHSAIAASAAAGADGTASKTVVLLTEGKTITSSVRSYLNALSPKTTKIIPVGSSASYALTHTSLPHWGSSWYYYPVGGTGYDGVAANLAATWWGAPSQAGLADIDSWRGQVAAASAMNVYGPVLYTPPGSLSAAAKSYLRKGSANVQFVVAFGGHTSVTTDTLDAAGAAISYNSTAAAYDYTPYYDGQPGSAGAAAQALALGGTTAGGGASGPAPAARPAVPGTHDVSGLRATHHG
jgi:hypothetical protein